MSTVEDERKLRTMDNNLTLGKISHLVTFFVTSAMDNNLTFGKISDLVTIFVTSAMITICLLRVLQR